MSLRVSTDFSPHTIIIFSSVWISNFLIHGGLIWYLSLLSSVAAHSGGFSDQSQVPAGFFTDMSGWFSAFQYNPQFTSMVIFFLNALILILSDWFITVLYLFKFLFCRIMNLGKREVTELLKSEGAEIINCQPTSSPPLWYNNIIIIMNVDC